MKTGIMVQAIEDGAGGLYVAYIVNDECKAIFSGFEYNPESCMLTELENAYRHGIADWENPHEGEPEEIYARLVTGQTGTARIIGQMDDDGYLDWPRSMGGNGQSWARLKGLD